MRTNQKSLTLNRSDENKRFAAIKVNSWRWNQILSGILCAGGFSIILALVLLHTVNEAREISVEDQLQPWIKNTEHWRSDHDGCDVDRCEISCRGLQGIEDLTTIIEEAFQKISIDQMCGEDINLVLSNINFVSTILTKGWIVTTNFKIKTLRIEAANIKNIEPGAFEGDAFKSTTDVIIEKITFEHLQAETFRGMNVITKLYIRNCQFTEIDESALFPISNTLAELQIQETIGVFDPTNLTGNIHFGSISLVDFRFNNIDSTIKTATFSGLSACKQLFLSNSQINNIEDRAFENMREIVLLDLSNNRLTTLPPNTFDKNNMKFSLLIDKNLWDCICGLLWLKNMQLGGYVKGIPRCETPTDANGRNFTEVEFCPEEEITTPSEIEENTIEIICKIYNPTKQVNTKRKLLSVSTQILSPNIIFQIIDVDDGIIRIEIESDFTSSDILLWFSGNINFTDMEDARSIGCNTRLSPNTNINDLEFGQTYTFCLVRGMARKISPLNCRAHVVALPWRFQSWLENKDKIISISIVSLALVLCCLIGAVVLYLVVRRNPSLLRGSKRIVMVKHRVADAIVIPPNFKKCPDPIKINEKKLFPLLTTNPSKAFKRTTFRRSVSESSMLSGRSEDATYVSALEPTAVQLLHWRLERLRNGTNTAIPQTSKVCAPSSSLGKPSSHTIRVPDTPPLPPIPPSRPISPGLLNSDLDNLSGIIECDNSLC